MFEPIQQVFTDLREHLTRVREGVVSGGDYFHALALAESYNYLIELADTRTQQHPEVQRVPELRTLLLAHLMENADQHINVRNGTIFNESLLGSPRTLRDWQDAGYHIKRNAANYQSRLRYWQAIYDGAPVAFQERIQTEDIFAPKVYQSTLISPKGKIPRRPSNKQTGALVTYEEVIHKRNARYKATLIPWWHSLNYGTGGQGYPVSPGLHFVEDAERTVSLNVTRYIGLFDQFVSDVFADDALSSDTILVVESWLRRHIQITSAYIPIFDVARIISFGVPF
jgi:hypothetical protein